MAYPLITVYEGLTQYHGILQYLQITVYVGSPKYQGILQYLESPFISVRQNIAAFISYRQASYKSLSTLPTIMILQLSELSKYHSIIISAR